MRESDPTPLRPAERRALEAMAVRMAHDDPGFVEAMRGGRTVGTHPLLRRRLVGAAVIILVLVASTSLLAGAAAGLAIGSAAVVTAVVVAVVTALHRQRREGPA